MSATSELVGIIVTLQDVYCDQIAEVADHLRNAGMTVENIMEPLGMIAGSIEAGKKGALSRVKGVAHVETNRQFQLAPPDSKIH